MIVGVEDVHVYWTWAGIAAGDEVVAFGSATDVGPPVALGHFDAYIVWHSGEGGDLSDPSCTKSLDVP